MPLPLVLAMVPPVNVTPLPVRSCTSIARPPVSAIVQFVKVISAFPPLILTAVLVLETEVEITQSVRSIVPAQSTRMTPPLVPPAISMETFSIVAALADGPASPALTVDLRRRPLTVFPSASRITSPSPLPTTGSSPAGVNRGAANGQSRALSEQLLIRFQNESVRVIDVIFGRAGFLEDVNIVPGSVGIGAVVI